MFQEIKHLYPFTAKEHDPDSKVHGANMAPTWVLLAPFGPHVGPMNLAMRGGMIVFFSRNYFILREQYKTEALGTLSAVAPDIYGTEA